MKNILFVSYDGMTDPLGQSQVIPYMQGLTKAGFNITILSCEKPQVYLGRRDTIKKILDDSGIDWVPLKYTKKPAVLSTVYDTYKLKRAARKIHLAKGIHLVHTRTGTTAIVGHWLKKKYGIKFLNDIRDFFADSRVDAGMWDQQNLLYRMIYRYFKRAEAQQIKDNDGIVCLTYTAEKIIKKWPEYNNKTPLVVIPCSVDLDLFNAENLGAGDRAALQFKFKISDSDTVISYLGSIGGWYLVEEMMRFFRQLLNKDPNAKFLFISPHSHQQILDAAKGYDVPADRIISVKGNRPEIPLLLSLSDYSIFFIKPCYSKLASSPTKHGELMAMGIPVITNSGVGDIKEIVERYSGGFIVEDFSDKSFNEVVVQMENTFFNKRTIRKGAIDFYSLQNAVAQYTFIYKEILKD